MLRPRLPAVCAAVVLVTGAFILHAAGSGPPARGLPYQGRLEWNGVPVSDTVPMTFRLFDDAAAGTELHAESLAVPVAEGAFAVTLGTDGTPLPATVFDAAELFVEVEVDGVALSGRQPIYALPQAVRAGQGLNLEVTGGRLWQGPVAPSGVGQDLGLYSSTAGRYVRLVSNGGRFVFYSDGTAANGGYGTTPVFQILETGRLISTATLFGAITDVTTAATAANASAPVAASQNGFLTVQINADTDGDRGTVETWVRPASTGVWTRLGIGSVHGFINTDNHIRYDTHTVPIGLGDGYYVVHTPTSGATAVSVLFRPLMAP